MLRLALLLALSSALLADAGDSISAWQQVVSGPILALILSGGAVATVWLWYAGHRKALYYSLTGIFFLAVMKTVVGQYFGSPSFWGFSIPGGNFPVYGDTGGVATASGQGTIEAIRSWAMLGVVYMSNLISFAWTKGAIAMIVLAGALIVYKRVTMRHEAGAILPYLVATGLITALCCVPLVSYTPRTTPGLVETAIDAANGGHASDNLRDSTKLQIPILPAAVIATATDVATLAGEALTPAPASAYARQVQVAARSSQLSKDQLDAYEMYGKVCGAGAMGMRIADANTLSGIFTSAPSSNSDSPAYISKAAVQNASAKERFSYTALSPWGDAIFYGVPFEGYIADDYSELHESPYKGPFDDSGTVAFGILQVPTPLSDANKFSHDGLLKGFIFPNLGAYRGTVQSDSPTIPVPTRNGEQAYPRPIFYSSQDATMFGAEMLGYTKSSGSLLIPVCSLPIDDSNGIKQIKFDRDSTNDPWTPDSGLATSNYYGWIASSYPNLPPSGQEVSLRLWPIADNTRSSIISAYSNSDLCTSIAGEPTNPSWWGCLVSGAFERLPASALTDTQSPLYNAAKTSEWFWSGDVPTQLETELKSAALKGGSISTSVIPNRSDTPTARAELKGGVPESTSIPTQRLSTDLLFAGAGIARQLGVLGASSESASPGAIPEGKADSIWTIVLGKPLQAIIWLFGLIAEGITYIVVNLWPHFVGITMMLVLTIYAIVCCIALWPGKWTILVDWSLGCCWVIAWFVPMSMGMGFINSASSGVTGIITGTDPPQSGTMRVVGGCLVMMAPVIVQAFMMPSFDAIAKLGGAVYGTGFKIVGAAAQLAALVGGVTAGIAGAAISSAAGGAAVAAGKSSLASSATTAGSNAAEAAAAAGKTAANGSGGGPAGPSRILASASRAASYGMAAGRGASSVVSATASAASLMGGSDLASGSQAGRHIGEVGVAATREAGAAATIAARVAARGAGSAAQAGLISPDGAAARVASDLAKAAPTGAVQSATGQVMAATDQGLLAAGGDAVTAGKLLDAKQQQADQVARQAAAAGDRGKFVEQALRTSASSRAAANAARERGDYGVMASQSARYAEAENQAFENGGHMDFQRATSSAQEAIRSGQEVERAGIATGNKGWVSAGRAAQTQGAEFLARAHARQASLLMQQGEGMLQEYADKNHNGDREAAASEMAKLDNVAGREWRQNRGEADEHRRQAGFYAEQAMGGYQTAYTTASAQHEAAIGAIQKAGGNAAPQSDVRTAIGSAVEMGAIGAQSDALAKDLQAANVVVERKIQPNQVAADLSRPSGNDTADRVATAARQALQGQSTEAASSLRQAGQAAEVAGYSDVRVSVDAAAAAMADAGAPTVSGVQRQAVLSAAPPGVTPVASPAIARHLKMDAEKAPAIIDVRAQVPARPVIEVDPL